MNLSKFEGVAPNTLLKELDLFDAPVDLEAICQELGVKRSSGLTFSSHSGEIKVDSSGQVNIWINPMDPPNRRRFTLAHELGHLVHDIIPYIRTEKGISQFTDDVDSLKRDGRQHPEEYRANDFAAKLLMPKKLIKKYGDKIIEEIQKETGKRKVPLEIFVAKMAMKFKVSEQAMRIRLENLGAI